jgi:4-cresol dehydrogenase (hydroxylating)
LGYARPIGLAPDDREGIEINTVLPAGVTAADFARALTAFGAAVGNDYVLSDPAQLASYGRIMMPVPGDEHRPSAVVMPASVAEIQQILSAARRWRIPLWTVSTGRNFGYGSAAPATDGQVVLELRRMNRILDVDAELGTALIEPGVTYKQLQDHLRERNIALWLDFPAPGPLVSPVGNSLERGGGLTPYGDHFGHVCGMEVVLADGSVLKTGLGGVDNTSSWQVHRYGYGPYVDGLFTQSNYGIVTKMGLWLMPAPPAHRTIMAQWERDEDIGRAIEAIRPLRLSETIPNFGVLANATLIMTSLAKRAEVYAGTGAIPMARALEFARSKGLPAWVYLFSLYGTPEQIEVDTRIVQTALERSGAKLVLDFHDPMQSNELSLQAFSLFNWNGGGGLCWFSPVCPNRGADVVRQTEMARRIMDRHGIDFMTGMTINGRDILNVMPLVFNRADAQETARARACFDSLLTDFAAAGYGFYRTGIGFMDRVAELNGAAARDFAQRLKRAIDPLGILAPGKSGIHV